MSKKSEKKMIVMALSKQYLEARAKYDFNFGVPYRNRYLSEYRQIALELAPFLDEPLHIEGKVLVPTNTEPRNIQMYTEESYKRLMDYKAQFDKNG